MCTQLYCCQSNFTYFFRSFFKQNPFIFVIQTFVWSPLIFHYLAYNNGSQNRQKKNLCMNVGIWWLVSNRPFNFHSVFLSVLMRQRKRVLFNRFENINCPIYIEIDFYDGYCQSFSVFFHVCCCCCICCICCMCLLSLVSSKNGQQFVCIQCHHYKSELFNFKCHWHTKPNDIRLAIILIMTGGGKHIYEISKCGMDEWMKPHWKYFSIGRLEGNNSTQQKWAKKYKNIDGIQSISFVTVVAVVVFSMECCIYSLLFITKYKTVLIRAHKTHTRKREKTR